MSKFVINGGKKLSGEITVAGNKNAALPIIAATILTDEDCILENVPDIRDVQAIFDIAMDIGKNVEQIDSSVYKISGTASNPHPNPELVQKLRASILFLGALLAKTGKASIAPPGGCVIGRRHIAPHFEALTDLGMEIEIGEHAYFGKRIEQKDSTTFLHETSVTATENAMLAASTSPNKTIIENAACEPHVADLAKMLQKMGVSINGIGSNRMEIQGVKKLKGVRHRISSDYIETGTFAILAASTNSVLTLNNIEPEHMQMTGFLFNKMGIELDFLADQKSMTVKPNPLKSPGKKIQVGLWPNFPTDLMSPMIVLATQAEGTTLCHDWMFESRMFFVDKLIAMGADITLCDPHRALVSGPTQLRGQNLSSPDIRAGIALVIAALSARGESEIANAELVDRGYQNIVDRLKNLGADIRREK
ncbi:MAG: UDP-N-acetylglucosamine 1-carboxyvinyltransferase [Calditrichaeota bacterium]|nr:MAG: UDP-N-acetylglucosamine 1-carboxyvinyltransferase [Calditrichota bacterium]MBL1204416.1 UDP-N-acetylglucosamine 1-carboxyvinyltransferase [Calditrichota bacterium]NOG44245.1 UDP-N-acetylglucosamine 1-carboxyvinyltransferase [Calditrichota bacterium]